MPFKGGCCSVSGVTELHACVVCNGCYHCFCMDQGKTSDLLMNIRTKCVTSHLYPLDLDPSDGLDWPS